MGIPGSSGDAIRVADLTDFVARYRPHGQLTADPTDPTADRYMLTVLCRP